MPPIDPCDHSQVLIFIPGPLNNKYISQFMLGSTKKKKKEACRTLCICKTFFQKCYIYNIFITNHRWFIVISSNLNLPLKLFFSPTIMTSNNLPLKIYCKNVLDNEHNISLSLSLFFFFFFTYTIEACVSEETLKIHRTSSTGTNSI